MTLLVSNGDHQKKSCSIICLAITSSRRCSLLLYECSWPKKYKVIGKLPLRSDSNSNKGSGNLQLMNVLSLIWPDYSGNTQSKMFFTLSLRVDRVWAIELFRSENARNQKEKETWILKFGICILPPLTLKLLNQKGGKSNGKVRLTYRSFWRINLLIKWCMSIVLLQLWYI